jgi:hypothetical protein
MSVTKYHFDYAISAFFEMNRDAAKACLPAHLEPMEPRHGLGVFALTAFHFSESMVGEYDEIVLAIITPPMVTPSGEWPRSAFYPFVVGTSTEESRQHAIERWHLPHYMSDINIDTSDDGNKVDIHVHEGDRPIIDAVVNAHKWTDVDHLYQSFMADQSGKYKANIHMVGQFTEHEEETGELEIHPHAMTEQLIDADVASFPFRELWMKSGVQTFEELETL